MVGLYIPFTDKLTRIWPCTCMVSLYICSTDKLTKILQGLCIVGLNIFHKLTKIITMYLYDEFIYIFHWGNWQNNCDPSPYKYIVIIKVCIFVWWVYTYLPLTCWQIDKNITIYLYGGVIHMFHWHTDKLTNWQVLLLCIYIVEFLDIFYWHPDKLTQILQFICMVGLYIPFTDKLTKILQGLCIVGLNIFYKLTKIITMYLYGEFIYIFHWENWQNYCDPSPYKYIVIIKVCIFVWRVYTYLPLTCWQIDKKYYDIFVWWGYTYVPLTYWQTDKYYYYVFVL